MNKVVIKPEEYPREKNESWYVVHPNAKGCQFRIPVDAVTACTADLHECRKNTAYPIFQPNIGWVGVKTTTDWYVMPEYIFARHFDAEAFVIGTTPTAEELEGARPFDYRPTVPKKRVPQLELFEDK
ncbi:MAG: hypothetical protein ACXABY_34060 [Candidatus Thorarchaeota archaeon]|jgi:hypothetical protein